MRTFYFDINTIRDCNFRCDYCKIPFDGTKFSDELTDNFIDKIKYLLASDFPYDMIQIAFFGGEPSLNNTGIKKITDAFRSEPRVIFFLYSNGYKYSDKFYEFLESFKNEYIQTNDGSKAKFLTQISYDGLASHNVDRITKNRKETALEVKETIFKLREKMIPFQVHPTISARNFDKIADNYFEFERMSETLGFELGYSPTIDYLTHYKFSRDELENLKNILKIEFNKIAQSNIEHYKKTGNFKFGWFNPGKAICSAGDSFVGIELDGRALPCHGCFGTEDPELELAHLNQPNGIFKDNLLRATQRFNLALKRLPEECEKCYAHYCLKCNAAKYNNSKITANSPKVKSPDTLKYVKWTDYTNQPSLCELYKFIGRYRIALLKTIETS